jgi:hypothetical protein
LRFLVLVRLVRVLLPDNVRRPYTLGQGEDNGGRRTVGFPLSGDELAELLRRANSPSNADAVRCNSDEEEEGRHEEGKGQEATKRTEIVSL